MRDTAGADADDRIVAFSKGKTGGNKPKKSAGIVITLSMREMNTLLEILYWSGNEVGPDHSDQRKLHGRLEEARRIYLKNKNRS